MGLDRPFRKQLLAFPACSLHCDWTLKPASGSLHMPRHHAGALTALAVLGAAIWSPAPGSAFLIWPQPPDCAAAAHTTPCAATTFLDPARLTHAVNGTSRAADPARGAPGCCSVCPPGSQTNALAALPYLPGGDNGGGAAGTATTGATTCTPCPPGRYTHSSAEPCRAPAPTQVLAPPRRCPVGWLRHAPSLALALI